MRVVLRIRQGCNRRRHASALVMAVPTERVSVVIVPVVVRRPFVAAQALGIRPLAPTARTDASGIERVPGVEAGTHPKVVRTGFPATTWTANAVATGTVTGGLSGSWNTYTIRLALQQQVAVGSPVEPSVMARAVILGTAPLSVASRNLGAAPTTSRVIAMSANTALHARILGTGKRVPTETLTSAVASVIEPAQ